MTDQEKMRAEFEAAHTIFSLGRNGLDFYMVPEVHERWQGWQACAAHSAETIARLEEEIRRLEYVAASIRNMLGLHKTESIYDHCQAMKMQLAASQLREKQLREAIMETKSLLAASMHEWRPFVEYEQEINDLNDALVQPLDTSALDAYVASKMPAWQPIETAPRDGRTILLYLGYPWEKIEKARWYEPWSNWQSGIIPSDPMREEMHGIGQSVPTHWMPLPPSPDKQGE